jgi:hypothetical protein
VAVVAKTLLLSGFDLREAHLPDDVRLLLPPLALPGLVDFGEAVDRALDEPLSGEPLSALVKPKSRICVVLDDPSWPVPPLSHDPRRELLAGVLRVFAEQGVRSKQVTVLVANGLGRQWRATELTDLLGIASTASFPVRCHDAEAQAELVRIGEEPEGPVELARCIVEADLVIHLNVVTAPHYAGLFGLVSGTAGYRTARWLSAPSLFEQDAAPLKRGSPFHQAHERVGALLEKKTRVFQVSAVLNNELWTPALASLFRTEHGLTRPLQMWNALPLAVRHRAARLMKGSCRPLAALSGPTGAVAARALEVFLRQHEVATDGPADVLVFGLPDQGPYSVRTAQNPVLAAHLALGYVANLCTGQPLLNPGGVILFANPLTPEFDRNAHLPHEEFYEKVLRVERDPAAIHERFEPYFAGRPEFVANYQRRYSFHGAHPLYCWYQCTPARKRAGKIIVAHGDPRACARLGFMPANDVDDGLAKARELLGRPDPSVLVLELPPSFFVRVR